MSTTSQSLVEALARAHKALRDNIGVIDGLLNEPAGLRPADLGKRLESLQHTLLEHFRFEEKDGYLDNVVKGRPHLDKPVARLLEEHARLARDLTGLIEETGRMQSTTPEFTARAKHWIAALLDHETRENLLVEDAFTRDEGTKD